MDEQKMRVEAISWKPKYINKFSQCRIENVCVCRGINLQMQAVSALSYEINHS